MRTLGLALKVMFAFTFYGVIGLVIGLLSSLFWPDMNGELIFKWTVAVGLACAVFGAAMPFTRNRMLDVLALFAPSNW